MKVAILISTLNLPSFIQRTVLYYDSLKSPQPIYIGDASNTEISKKTLLFLKNIKNVEVKYFHWEGLNYEQTVLKLAEEASADYEFWMQCRKEELLEREGMDSKPHKQKGKKDGKISTR